MAERLFEIIGLQITKIDLRFKERQDGKEYKRFRYIEGMKETADVYPLSIISSMSFMHKRKDVYSDIVINIINEPDHCEWLSASYDYFSFVIPSRNASVDEFCSMMKKLREALSEAAFVNYFIADRMKGEKNAGVFSAGIGYSDNSDFENRIAHSISKSKNLHYMLPYLFMYNYHYHKRLLAGAGFEIKFPEMKIIETNNYSEVLFPRCCGIDFENYGNLPEWSAVYKLFSRLGIVVFPEE